MPALLPVPRPDVVLFAAALALASIAAPPPAAAQHRGFLAGAVVGAVAGAIISQGIARAQPGYAGQPRARRAAARPQRARTGMATQKNNGARPVSDPFSGVAPASTTPVAGN
ncbi:hypothetical protein RHODGE_RHODGE_02478 [Rhodoplanes serenus]|uniref:Glycine zipper domain-containing protein n=1 Tax=Rhodoplanes serenus TaxID=200615 RepID=A0A447CVI2_9BRAD|nr:hypothetical protein [Rhodoplanes serenus]VCU09304.1 hypothetical protein RHODGE_RHODGE_02478 [Rhodoplanes serenus]